MKITNEQIEEARLIAALRGFPSDDIPRGLDGIAACAIVSEALRSIYDATFRIYTLDDGYEVFGAWRAGLDGDDVRATLDRVFSLPDGAVFAVRNP